MFSVGRMLRANYGPGFGVGRPLRAPIAGVGLSRLPFNTAVGAVGDSILWAQGAGPMRSVCDIPMWANARSGGRCMLPYGYNQAVGGAASDEIVAQLEKLPPGIDIVIANGGTNNLADGAASILADWDEIIAWCAAHGVRLIIIPILPRSANDGTAETTRATVNAGLLTRASSAVVVIDISWFDYTDHCYPQPGTGERVHPNVIGVTLLADEIATVLQSWVASGDPLAQGTNAHPNGLMTGTSGTLNGFTGVLPADWVGNPDSNRGSITVACSRPARAAGGNWLQMVLGGTFNEGARVVARYTIPGSAFVAAGITGGDLFEICFEFEVDGDLVNVDTFYCGCTLFATDFDPIPSAASGYLNETEEQGGFTLPAYTGKVRMMPFGLPVGDTVNWMLCDFIAYPRDNLANGSAIAGTIRVGGVNVRKVPAGVPWRMDAPSLTPSDDEISVDRAAAPFANGAAITSYDLRWSTDEETWTVVTGISDPQVIGGLATGTTYFVQTRAVNSAGPGPWSESASATTEWTPAALFANGEDGWWYDFTDVATMSQDTAGSTPVTASGQSVGRITDKSGNAHHIVAKDGTTGRPTYTLASGLHYLAFDGGDYMSGTGVTDVDFVGAAPYIGSGGGTFAAPMAFAATNFDGALQRDNATTNYRTGTWLFNDNSGMRINGVATRAYGAANTAHVMTMPKTFSGDCPQVRLGGTTTSNDPFTGRLYGCLVGVNRSLTTGERNSLEAYIAARCGVTL